jgi:hypothetical protein
VSDASFALYQQQQIRRKKAEKVTRCFSDEDNGLANAAQDERQEPEPNSLLFGSGADKINEISHARPVC